MNGFLKFVVRIAVVLCVLAIVLLLAAAVLLVCAPDLLMKILYYGLIGTCIVGAACLVYSLVRSLCDAHNS